MKQRLITFSVFLLALLGISSLLFAQTLDLFEEYTQSALWINTNRNTGFYTSYLTDIPLDTSSSLELRWTPYQGMQPLGKATFLQIAGMDEDAMRYQQSQKTAQLFNWTGLTLFLAGTLILAASQVLEPGNKVLLYSSLGLIFGGITAGGISMVINNNSQIPVNKAVEAAALYNENLKKQLGIE
jgi:hypothetical protein